MPSATPTETPSAPPTHHPSVQHTAGPSSEPTGHTGSPSPGASVPTVAPTVGEQADDCTDYCSYLMRTAESITAGKRLAVVQLPREFELKFSIRNLASWSGSSAGNNILSLVDMISGAPLLEISIIDSEYLVMIKYAGFSSAVSVTLLLPLMTTDWTVVTVTADLQQMMTWSSVDPYAQQLPGYTSFNTAGKSYVLLTSAPGVDSAGGSIADIQISGQFFIF